MKRLLIASMILSTGLMGCATETTETTEQEQLLSEYRRAIPTLDAVSAPEVAASTTPDSNLVGGPALMPLSSLELVLGVNLTVAALVITLEVIVNTPPTTYNSDTREFVWGPFANQDGVGYAAVYIREAPAGDDFQYHYAFLRGIDNDLANLTPVIWGGASPDPANEDYGAGIVLFDFEANYEFEAAHNPEVGSMALDRGRFAILFAAGEADDNAANESAFVV
ncbi:MAG: hypothetical protein AAGC55_23010, partial [Myxococcota bacterium]